MKKTTPPKEAQDDEEKEKEKRNWKEERKKAGERGESCTDSRSERNSKIQMQENRRQGMEEE